MDQPGPANERAPAPRCGEMSAALTFSAVFPSLLLLWYFYSRDKYPEPPRVVITAFVLGVATIPLVLGFGAIVERAIGPGPADPYLAAEDVNKSETDLVCI